jgi:PAS domain S-box-containing protein
MDLGLHNESERMALLRSLSLLYLPPEPLIEDLLKQACYLAGAPMALLINFEEDVRWCGPNADQGFSRSALADEACNLMVAQAGQPMVLSDLTAHERFRSVKHVRDGHAFRSFAGVPLMLQEGFPIGMLGVFDTQSRTPAPVQMEMLQSLARSTTAMIEFRRAAISMRASEVRYREMLEAATDAVLTIDDTLRVTRWNAKADVLFGLSNAGEKRLTDWMTTSPDDADPAGTVARWIAEQSAGHASWQFEAPIKDRYGVTFMGEVSVAASIGRGETSYNLFLRDASKRIERDSRRHETELRDVVIYALARLAESRDPETGSHIERVQHYCRALAEQLLTVNAFPDLLDDEFVRLIYSTSPLHDIGKVGIPDHVLLKPGKLTPQEFEIMKTHAQQGAATLDSAIARFPNTRFLHRAREIAVTHHERFDGTGYPNALAGEAIPLCGRIVALADVYDALTSQRVYKAPMSHEMARELIVKESGKQFDPKVVEAFLAIEHSFSTIRRQHSEPVRTVA